MEKTINSNLIFQGKVVSLKVDTVLINEHISKREVIEHNGGVCIAIKKDDKFAIVKQYRYALKQYMLEFTAGKLEKDEYINEAVLREANEETGYTIENLEYVGKIHPSCGYLTEVIHLFKGDAIDFVGQNFDEGEDIEVKWFTKKEIDQMIRSGEISDAKTIALAYFL